ncbi:MAG: hypothetical protein JWM32_3228 [Verrucomicrobia bacterium]|nr:hypothetical protein [Verrucomicrobiota bacterium]
MKTLKIGGAILALAFSLAARGEVSAHSRLENYYQNPQVGEVPRLVQALSHQGYFDESDHVTVAIGFLGTVFAQNPSRVDSWLPTFRNLPTSHQRLIAAALWQAGNPRGAEMLRTLSRTSAFRPEIEHLAEGPSVAIAQTPVLSTASMNLQWGAFLASGDRIYVTNVLAAIGTGAPGLDEAARYTLAENAATHARVMEICQAELAKTPTGSNPVLRAALEEAAKGTTKPDHSS